MRDLCERKSVQSYLKIKKSLDFEGKKGTTCLVRSSNWYGEGKIGTVRLF